MRKQLIIASLAILSFATAEASAAQVDSLVSNLPPTLSDKASIDCTKAGSAVAKILCGSHEGATADWDLNSTLWAIAGTITEAQQKTFDQDQDHWRSWLNARCLQPPLFAGDISQDKQRCVISEFHSRAAKLRSKLTGDALAESKLSPEQHAQIQELLIARGLLQPPADGEFGSSTRQAITKLQAIEGVSQTGFLSREQASQLRTVNQSTQSSLPALAATPSFNCAKATYADEYAICSNAELSRLDIVANAGYEYLRYVYGHLYANSITLPLLRVRHACRSNFVCIKEQQLAAIEMFRSLGAPINRVGGLATPPTPQSNSVPNAQSPQVASQLPQATSGEHIAIDDPTATYLSNLGKLPSPTPDAQPAKPTVAAVTPPATPPDDKTIEAAFISAVDDARAEYDHGQNDLIKGAARVHRRERLCQLMHALAVHEWTGTVTRLSSSSSGKGVLDVSIAPQITIATTNNALSDSFEHTLLEPDSDVFRQALSLSKGQRVVFSGFFQSSDTDCVQERSLTQQGSMTDPEFAFRFTDVQSAK